MRSTSWVLFAALAFSVGFAALEAVILSGHLSAAETASLDPVRVSLGGSHLTQIVSGVMGTLVITSEYTNGLIRVTLSGVPRRRRLLAAKAVAFASTAPVAGVAVSSAAFFVFEGLLTGHGLHASVGDPGVARALIGGGLYLTVFGLLGLGLGTIIRSPTGAIVFGSSPGMLRPRRSCRSCSVAAREPGTPMRSERSWRTSRMIAGRQCGGCSPRQGSGAARRWGCGGRTSTSMRA